MLNQTNMRLVASRSWLAALCAAGIIGTTAAQAQSSAAATVAPTKPSFRAIDRIGVTADTRPLSKLGSNFRIYAVPADTPDAIADVNAFALASTSIRAALHRMTLP